MPEIVIYSSASGGTPIQKKTEALNTLLVAKKVQPKIVYLDVERDKQDEVFAKSGQKGVYPLLFVNGEYIGTYEDVVTLNEEERLDAKIY